MGFFQTLFVASFVFRFCNGAFYGNATLNSTSSSLPLPSLSLSSQYSSSAIPSLSQHSSSAIPLSIASIQHSSSRLLEASSIFGNSSSLPNTRSSLQPASYPITPSNSSTPFNGPTNGYTYLTGARSGSALSPSRSYYAQSNSSFARVTGTGGLRPLATGRSYYGTGYGTGLGSSNATTSRKWSNATMTAAPPGFAIYGNSTFRTNCPHQTAYNSTDCYATCTKLADRCYSEWYTWSQGNNAYQSKMQAEQGEVEIPEKTLVGENQSCDLRSICLWTSYANDVPNTCRYTHFHQAP